MMRFCRSGLWRAAVFAFLGMGRFTTLSHGAVTAAVPAELHPNPAPPPALGGRDRTAGPGIRLGWVAPGTFRMGGPAADDYIAIVHLRYGFWLGRTELTQGQWEALMGNNPSKFRDLGPAGPVDSVSWNDAAEYCRRLTLHERAAGNVPLGYEFRLPTEAEWEYACRSGTKSKGEVNGDGVLADVAWYAANSGGHPHPVATRQPNQWGFYDMLGNVGEWCFDWLGASLQGEATDPAGPDFGTFRVTRGGNWWEPIRYMPLSRRLWQDPSKSGSRLGFRIALAPQITAPPLPAELYLRIPPGPGAPADLAGRKIVVGQNGIELLWIPPGPFTMGEPPNIPAVRVQISRGFWLGRTKVTQAQWTAVMGSNPSHFRKEGPDAPVDTVSYHDAIEFCRRIGAKERETGQIPAGYEYCVPTEAEWEYACRAGTTGRFAGDGQPGNMGWYDENSGGHTHPVAQKLPNAWGLYDMEGSLREPVSDFFGVYPTGEVTDPAGVRAGTWRSSRGGCWESNSDTLGSGHRHAYPEDFKSDLTGMRLALAPSLDP